VGPTSGGQDWENTNSNGGSNPYSILAAGCRPATFLNWVRNGNQNSGVGTGIWAKTGGMCAHGNSGGAGALGYALAWYNAGVGGAPAWGSGYLDKVEMENGPVFSDLQQGCQVSNGASNQATYICDLNESWEPGCNNWPQGTAAVDYPLVYIAPDRSPVNQWTGNANSNICSPSPTPACGQVNTHGYSSCTAQNQSWYSQSIVNFPKPPALQPSFNYPNTSITGWACSNVTGEVENNSAPEGQLFFNQFQSASQPISYYGVSQCPTNENVEYGIVYYDGQYYGGPGTGQGVSQAIINDMTTGTLSCNALKRSTN
jgi:hypothetical protein